MFQSCQHCDTKAASWPLSTLYVYRNCTTEGTWREQGNSQVKTDTLTQIYRRNYFKEQCDFLISVFTKVKTEYAFKCINKVCHPKRKENFLSWAKIGEIWFTSKPGNLKVFSLVTFEEFLLFSTQHNYDDLYKTRTKSRYESLTEVDLNPH